MQEIRVEQKDASQRLDKFLKKHLPQAGGSFLYKMLRKKNIVLNGKKAEGSELIVAGDTIRFFFSDETYRKFRGSERVSLAIRAHQELQGIRVLYETEHLLFVDKPAGILSQSDASGALSLNDWIYGYAFEKGYVTEGDNFIPSIANRLDRNTSGIVMAAFTYAGSRFLSDMIRDHRLRKFYHAVAEGRIEADGELNGYLIKDPATNTVRVMTENENNSGEAIHTRYRVLSQEKGYTHLEVELITGKSHQIRAHLSSIGHPIAGDKKYGGHPYRGKHTQQLRAVRVEFPELQEDPFGMSARVISCD